MFLRSIIALALGVAAMPAAQWGAARMFAPGVVSGADADFAPTFSPSRARLLFTRGIGGPSSILESRNVDGHWSVPQPAGFSGVATDLEPSWSPDGRYVVFASDRGPEGHSGLTAHYYGREQIGGNLWRVEDRGGRWGPARRLSAVINRNASVWSPAVANGDVLYFMATDDASGRFRLHRAADAGEPGARVTNLPFSSGAANDVDPYVTPDEDLLIFSSDRGEPVLPDAPGPERLFIAFRPRSSAPLVCPMRVRGWDDARVSMVEARLSADRRILYFASRQLVHGAGETPQGAWDDGKANIWTTPFQRTLWAFPGAPARCATANLPMNRPLAVSPRRRGDNS